MGFSRQEYWRGLLCPPPGDLPHPGIESTSLMSLALAGGFFTPSATIGSPLVPVNLTGGLVSSTDWSQMFLSFNFPISLNPAGLPESPAAHIHCGIPIRRPRTVWVNHSCPTLCDLMDFSLPGSSVHGIFQARILEWVAMPSSRGSSQLRDQTHVSYVSYIGRWVLYHWYHLGSPEYV